MKFLIAFTILLLVIQFDQGVSRVLFPTVGLSQTIYTTGPPRNITRCLVTHNNITYSIYPDLNVTNAKYTGFRERCNFEFNEVNFDHAGNWTTRSYWTGVNNTMHQNISSIELIVNQGVDALPSEYYSTDDGNYLTIFTHKVFDSLTNCTLIHRLNRTTVTKYNLLNTSQTNPTMELYGKCGVRLLVNESRYGGWQIKQDSGRYKRILSSFIVQEPPKQDLLNEINVWWNIGSAKEIGLFSFYSSRYCTITQPDGQEFILENDRCVHRVSEVTNAHMGRWTLRYLINGKMELAEKIYNVHVYDPNFVNITVNTTNNQRFHLLCRIPEKDLYFCLFIKPDGTVINLPQGVGNNKYEYYGNGYTKAFHGGYSDCGITIRQPSADDFGLWKCSLGLGEKVLTALVPVHDNQTNEKHARVSKHTFVKRGDKLMIKCQTSVPLEYCWLQSPNGTIYTLSNGKKSENNLSYNSESLAIGVCSAKVENASNEHTGNWTCRLGIMEGGEVQILVPVTVTKSYLFSNQSLINIMDDEKSTLTCNVLPEYDAVIKYCRWLRPDNYGIYKENSSQYSTSHKRKSCSLQIKEHNSKNIGKWTCYARLFDDLDEEVFATIDVILENKFSNSVMGTLLNIVASSFLIITLVGSCIVGIIMYRRKLRDRKQIGYCVNYEIHENEVKIPQDTHSGI